MGKLEIFALISFVLMISSAIIVSYLIVEILHKFL